MAHGGFGSINDYLSRITITTDFLQFMHRIEEAYFDYLNAYPIQPDDDWRRQIFMNAGMQNETVLSNVQYFSGPHGNLYQLYKYYKGNTRICGAALVDPRGNHLLVCRGFGRQSWTVPVGKMASDTETTFACAQREVREEVNFQVIEGSMLYEDEKSTIYLVKDVPINTVFRPTVPHEIEKIG